MASGGFAAHRPGGAVVRTRYNGIPEADSHEGYGDMENFVLIVEDETLREALWRALEGRHPLQRFKDVLAGHRRERERWFAFQDERTRRRVLDWLASEGIAAIVGPEPVREAPPLRPVFIAETLTFMRAASKQMFEGRHKDPSSYLQPDQGGVNRVKFLSQSTANANPLMSWFSRF